MARPAPKLAGYDIVWWSMVTFGDRLKRERERRKVSLREVESSTKIGVRYLKALESNAFDRLPGGVFNKGYVRAYSQFLGIDADEMVSAYCTQQSKTAELEAADPLTGLADALERQRIERHARLSRGRIYAIASVVVLVVGAGATVWWLQAGPADTRSAARTATPVETPSEQTVPASEPEPAPEPEPIGATVADTSTKPIEEETPPAPPEPEPQQAPRQPETTAAPQFASKREPVEVEPAPPAEPVATNTEPTPSEADAQIRVSESGVGTAVVNRSLVGAGDRFEQGTQVFFWTRVLGGESGEHIRHVWLHQGETVSAVELPVGGPHWRTQSRFTMGESGAWAVEARDDAGNVLSRVEFQCVSSNS